MILTPETGSYVIAALLVCALGIVVTMLIQKHKRMKKAAESGQAAYPKAGKNETRKQKEEAIHQ